MSDDIQPVDADLEDLKDEYPEGTILKAEKDDDVFDDGVFRAKVTGHHVVESTPTFQPAHPGPRVDVSTNPPDEPPIDGEVNGAFALRPSEIIDVVKRGVDE